LLVEASASSLPRTVPGGKMRGVGG